MQLLIYHNMKYFMPRHFKGRSVFRFCVSVWFLFNFSHHCSSTLLPSAETHNLQSLHTILSTGSPLKPQSYDYVYRCIKSNVLLGSISGDCCSLMLRFFLQLKLILGLQQRLPEMEHDMQGGSAHPTCGHDGHLSSHHC